MKRLHVHVSVGDRADLGAVRMASGGLVPSAAPAGACCASKQQAAE